MANNIFIFIRDVDGHPSVRHFSNDFIRLKRKKSDIRQVKVSCRLTINGLVGDSRGRTVADGAVYILSTSGLGASGLEIGFIVIFVKDTCELSVRASEIRLSGA